MLHGIVTMHQRTPQSLPVREGTRGFPYTVKRRDATGSGLIRSEGSCGQQEQSILHVLSAQLCAPKGLWPVECLTRGMSAQTGCLVPRNCTPSALGFLPPTPSLWLTTHLAVPAECPEGLVSERATRVLI
jgi:hypothetical protein